MKEKKTWWDKPVGKWVFYLTCALSLALIIGAGNFGAGVVNDAQDGAEALKKVDVIEIKIDTLTRCVKEQEKQNVIFVREVRQEYDRQKELDSVQQFEALKYMEKLINQLESK